MPITYGGDDYGWLATQGGVADLPVPKQVLDLEKTLMGASKSGQDTSAYWDQLRPYFESRYDPELFKQNQAGYANQQGDALIAQAGGVKITPEQLQQMKNVNAQGGIYSVLDPSLNVAPIPNYAANRAAYQAQYTNPTATNAADFLSSLRNFGYTPVATVATTPTQRPRWTPAATPAAQSTPTVANLPMMSYGNVSAASTAPAAQNIPTSIPAFKGFGGGGRVPGFGGRGGFMRNTRGNIPTSMYGRV